MSHRITQRGLAVTLALSALLGCSCGSPSSPSPLSPRIPPTTLPLPATSWTVTGTVWDHGQAGPSPTSSGVVFGWISNERGGHTTGSIAIGADGRYKFSVPTDTTRVHVNSPKNQPCVASVAITGNVTMDVHTVTDALQLGAHLPDLLSSQQPTLSGMVYEQSSNGRLPLANTKIYLDGLDGLGLIIATTLTDNEGRYVLCSVPPIRGLIVQAALTGFQLFESKGDLTGVTTLDIEMRRTGM